MALGMKEAGLIINCKVKVFLNTQMVIFLRVSGLRGKLMDLEYINIKMEEHTKEYGLMTCKMVEVFKNGGTEAVMKVNLKME